MENITSTAGLKNAIQLLEAERTINWQRLKEQFYPTCESLKPVNLLKSTLKDMVSSPYMIENILSTVLSLATGFLSKKLVVSAPAFGRFIIQHVLHKKEINSSRP
jgi:hypothetical protein